MLGNKINSHNNLCHGVIWPESQSPASPVHDSCCTHCRKQNHSGASDPWHRHTHFSHPVAIVLAVSDGMDDLEIAFKGDDHKTIF